MAFRAIVLREAEGKVTSSVEMVDEAELPDGDVTVAVEYSTINYKDGLVLAGQGRLVKKYPHIPGIDFAGSVTASASDRFAVGDKVVLTGWRVGEIWWGGLSQSARVKADWLVHLPKGMTTRQAMGIGTAGFTAMLSVMELQEHGVRPDSGTVAVTGAAGGVGSIAVALLAALGYQVAASTGRAATHDYLRKLGASEIIDRSTLAEKPTRPLLSERFAGGIDTVGSNTLANLLAQIKYRGSVAACGLAQGADLPASVAPFILRGVRLLGIDSVMCPTDIRQRAWERLARDLPMNLLEEMIVTEPLAAAPALGAQILKGEIRGRTVVDVNA
ncbi:MAG: MDR family oxidoreductase [Rhizomicrobium sp.]